MPSLYQLKNPHSLEYVHKKSDALSMDFHLHDGYEIFFLVAGDIKYLVENKVYPIQYGDLIITNQYEVHKPVFLSSKTYERIFIQFGADIPNLFRSYSIDLLACFENRPLGERNKISLDRRQRQDVLNLFSKMETACGSSAVGSEITAITTLVDLLVMINQIVAHVEPTEDHTAIPEKLKPVLAYIDSNMDQDLSLKKLENACYINRFYLSRLFKEHMGIHLHEYITYKRVSKAKQLLAAGSGTMDACQKSGFNDYSNFYRVFTRVVGASPLEYKKTLLSNSLYGQEK